MSEHEAEGKLVGREYSPTIRPLALPERFILAPMMCAVLGDMTTMLVSLVLMTQFNWPGFMLFAPVALHFSLIIVAFREPQIDYLLRAKLALRTARGPSRTQRARYPDAVRVLSPKSTR